MHAGTNAGQIGTFRITPGEGGKYEMEFCGSVGLDDQIVHIAPLNATSGKPALATPVAVAGLRDGVKTPGVVLAVSQSGARLFKPATNKGAHKSWDSGFCYAAGVARADELAYALVGLFGDGMTRAFSIPALKELAAVKTGDVFDVQKLSGAIVGANGDVLAWSGPSELTLVNLFGNNLDT